MLKRLHILFVVATIFTSVAYGQTSVKDLPYACQGSIESYWVKGNNGFSNFTWRVTDPKGNEVPASAIQFLNAGGDTVRINWNFPGMVGGVYTFHIIEKSGLCTGEEYTQDIQVNTPVLYVPISSFVNVKDNLIDLCSNGKFELEVEHKDSKRKFVNELSKWSDLSSAFSVKRIVSEAGTYTVKVVDDLASCSFDTAKVVMHELPKVSLGDDISICNSLGATIQSTVDHGNYYSWFVDGVQSSATGSSFTIEKPGVVSLTVKDDYGCEGSDAVKVSGCDPRNIRIPAAFTPNDDGVNDEWYIPGIEYDWVLTKVGSNNVPLPKEGKMKVDNLKIEIFTRWGKRVYSLKSDRKAWDGKDESGSPLPVDSYHYLIRFEVDGEKIQLRGPVTILL